MVPKFAAPRTAAGAPKFGVFRRLNTSARISTARPGPAGTRRMRARSTLRYAGPRTGFRDADPSVNCGATAKAAVLNQCAGVLWSAGSVGSPTRLGRCTPKPANALKFVAWVTAIGIPDCNVAIRVTVQSLASAPHTPRSALSRPAPTGRSHTIDDTNTCGMSPVE